MREAVVVASCRTPLAKSFTGSLNRTRSDDMTAHVIRAVGGTRPKLLPNVTTFLAKLKMSLRFRANSGLPSLKQRDFSMKNWPQ